MNSNDATRAAPRTPVPGTRFRRNVALPLIAWALLAAFAASPAALAQDAGGAPPPAPKAPDPAPPAGPAPAPAPQDPVTDSKPGEAYVSINSPKEGFTLLALLEAVNKQAERSVIYDSNIQTKMDKVKIQFVGSYRIPRSRLFDWLQGVLSFSQYILIPIGPEGAEQWMVVDLVNQAIRSRPTYVREEDLDKWKDRDGVYIVCTLRAKNLDQNDSQRARTAIQQLLTTSANIGRINEVPGQNAFVIADFAPVVYASKKLLEAMDLKIEANQQVLVRVQIQYALASDMEGMLNDLLSGVNATGQPRRPVNPQQLAVKPDPQIIADNRTNSLILYAVPEDIDKLKMLISQLDTEYRGKSKIHFRMLKYQEAEDVQQVLQDLISGASSSSSSLGRSGTSRSNRNTRNRTGSVGPTGTQPATQPFGGAGAGEGEPVIIADEKNNSLIIHSTEDQYADLMDLIDKLDRPRKQVLIETALMELTVGDSLSYGLDLFSVSDKVAVDTTGDGVVDTFTDEKSFFGLSFFNNSTIATTNVNGVDVPVGVSPNITQGFTAGIFNNGRIPIVLHALQSRTPAKILTMPSIVTSDNQSATIKTTDTVPFQTTTFVGPNQTPTTSFDEVSAETSLTISPSISADDFLRLNIKQQVSSFRSAPAGSRPPTTSRDIETELMVPNASTVVLGGIVSSQETETLSGIPILMDIPILGFLFRNTSTSLQKTNLFLFVTPTIMNDLKTFSDFHRVTWEKKLQQDKLFGEAVELLGAKFLGPDVPRAAQDALEWIDDAGNLDAYRYRGEPSESERLDSARRAWDRMQEEKRAAEEKEALKKAADAPPPGPGAEGPSEAPPRKDEPETPKDPPPAEETPR
jgi:general secretion pathway protein D